MNSTSIIALLLALGLCPSRQQPATPPAAAADQPNVAERVMMADASWMQCVHAAARHHAQRAGRAGTGMVGADAAFEDCARQEAELAAALTADGAIPAEHGGTVTERRGRLTAQLAEIMMQVYQDNNYE